MSPELAALVLCSNGVGCVFCFNVASKLEDHVYKLNTRARTHTSISIHISANARLRPFPVNSNIRTSFLRGQCVLVLLCNNIY